MARSSRKTLCFGIYVLEISAVVLKSVFCQEYTHIGCFKDTSNRALPNHLGNFDKSIAIPKCSQLAKQRGFTTFSVQYGGHCFSGATASQTYNKYGPATNCANGLGGAWANDVYSFIPDDVPEPVGLFPLNSRHTTKDISNSYLTAGTAVGVSLAPGPDGKPDGSYYLPGTAGSYIDIPKQPKLDTRYSLSIFAWIYNEGTPGPIIIYDTGNSQYALHMYINTAPANFFFRLMGRAGLTSNTHLSYNLVTVNNWRYVGYTYDYSTGYQRLYVDGVKVQEGVIAKQEIATNYKVRIGGTKYGDSRIFKGRISCVQFYDKALTQAQVLAVKHRCLHKDELYSACFQYTLLDDPTRAVDYKVSGQPPDRQAFIRRRWYRLKSKAGTRIVTSCPAPGSCGAQSPGWLNGQYPSLEIGIKKMEICYRSGADCCATKATVYVRQCYGYPVFMFDDVPDVSLGNRVCTETDRENIFPDAMFKSTNEQCLSGHVMYAESNVVDVSVCTGYCLSAGEKCQSVNFSNGKCDLNNATLTDYPLHVTVNSSCRYYERTKVMSYIP